jgi:hypothetical protein
MTTLKTIPPLHDPMFFVSLSNAYAKTRRVKPIFFSPLLRSATKAIEWAGTDLILTE